MSPCKTEPIISRAELVISKISLHWKDGSMNGGWLSAAGTRDIARAVGSQDMNRQVMVTDTVSGQNTCIFWTATSHYSFNYSGSTLGVLLKDPVMNVPRNTSTFLFKI